VGLSYRKRAHLSGRDIQLLFLIGLATVAVLGTLIGADVQLSRSLSGGGGFFAPWQAARAFIFHSAPPYSGTVASLTQGQVYGRSAQAGENPYILQIPFFLMPTYFPFALIADRATVRGIWMFINEAALVGMAFLSLRLIAWRPNRFFQMAFALVSVFGLYSVMSLLEGGPAILLGLLFQAVLFAFHSEQDELAGALLVFTLFAWEIGLFFVLFLLWKTIHDRRWRILAGFGMTLLVLLVVSLLIYPGWIFPFLTATFAMLRASFGTTSGAIFERISPAYGIRAAQAVTVLLLLLLLYEWAATRGADVRRFIWAASLTLAVTPLIGFRIELTNLVVLVPGLALILAAIANRWRTGYWQATLLLVIVFLLPWGWFVRWYWQQDRRAYDYLLLFLPLFTAVGLYWTRWWFVRPPRTWLDHVRSTLNPVQRLPNTRRSPSLTG
jgi:hypothetical protein